MVNELLMPRAILFDLDETLTDRRRSVVRYAERFQRDFAGHLGSAPVAVIASAIAAADVRGYRPCDEVLGDFSCRLPWRTVPDASCLRRHWATCFPRSIAARAGLEKSLSALHAKGIRLGIVTNGEVRFQEPKIARLSIGRYLSTVVISEAVQVQKPDPRIFAHALAELDCAASRAWFVGDHPVNDVLGAAAVGLRPIWLTGVQPWPPEHPAPTWQIAALGELITMAQRANDATSYDARMVAPNVAVGFLYHAASGKVLLHLRGADAPPNPGKWAFFGGRSEPEDGGDLLATWCREVREELGVRVDPARVVSLRHGTYDDDTRWHDFYCEWPSLDEDFVLTEGQRFAWFTLDEALSLPDLADYAREDLRLFREHLVRGH